LGGDTLLRLVKLAGLLVGVPERLERRHRFILVGIRRRIVQSLSPIAREYSRVLFRSGLGCRNNHAILFAQHIDRATAGAGHVDPKLTRSWSVIEQCR